MTRRSPLHDLDKWLDHHGYHHAHARKLKTAQPYVTPLPKSSALESGAVMVYPVTEKDPLGRARKDVIAGRKDHSTKAARFADLQRQGFMKRGPMRTWVVAVGSPSGDPGEDTYVEVQGKTEAAALRAAQVRKPGRRLTVRYAK